MSSTTILSQLLTMVVTRTNSIVPYRVNYKNPTGIGKELLATRLGCLNTTVIGGVRNPTSTISEALSRLPATEGSKFILVQTDSPSETDANDVVQLLRSKHNIQALDVVIANAAIGKGYGQKQRHPLPTCERPSKKTQLAL